MEDTSLPEKMNLLDSLQRKKWKGFLSTIRSVDWLLEKKGLYPWYSNLSLKVRESLKRHIRNNLPEGSIERFKQRIFREAMNFRSKFRRAVIDEGFILAETVKLDDDTAVLVKVPYEELAAVVHLMAISGRKNLEIAQVLGLSESTVEKLNRPENVWETLGSTFETQTINLLRRRTLDALLGKITKLEGMTPRQLTDILNFCTRWEDRIERRQKEQAIPVDDGSAQRERIEHRHQKLLEGRKGEVG